MIVIPLNAFKRYDVALSFAEENRSVVDAVAKRLKEQNVKVFYDNDFRIDSWGKELARYLDEAYRLQARFCVVFVSEEYGLKRWTNFEIKRAEARSFFENKSDFVLPYLLDDSAYSEQFKEVGCLTHRTHSPEQLAEAILKKLNQQKRRRLILWFKDLYRIKSRFATVLVLALASCTFFLRDHLTPVQTLAKRIYERSGRNVHGSICRDGTFSEKRGRGACAHHDGVSDPIDTMIYDKTLIESQKEAEQTSWIETQP